MKIRIIILYTPQLGLRRLWDGPTAAIVVNILYNRNSIIDRENLINATLKIQNKFKKAEKL